MARFAVALAVSSAIYGREQLTAVGHIPDPLNASSLAADKAAFETALATLVADGALPTQAHVTAANTAYTTFKADITAVPATADVVISFNATNVVTKAALKLAVLRLLRIIDGSDDLT